MGIPEIFHSVAIIVFIKVVLNSVRVKIAWPDELVYPPVVIVVLIKRVGAGPICIIISNAVIIMI